ncbi:hypothetical protein GCM10023321_58420 [Pseudonocardia eucalypti]|uniref:Uncharacterized protein n=1 Tax=Pseudonocardia eucalypti TaxID=648755 RepID=A0ABP9QSX9_9PSEU|nr:hypothetical protein [Pseudonocardia eucalypti]
MGDFKDEQIAALARSGWAGCASIVELVARVGLPAPTREYLRDAFSEAHWADAERAVAALRAHFAGARFAEEVRWGVLLVPDPARLDTRGPLPGAARRDQLGEPNEDVLAEALPAGTAGVPSGAPWTMVATVTGAYGPALGSHRRVVKAPAEEFTVLGTDTRRWMLRQLWGARVLQCGATPPDCERNERWTFTLFPGEPPVGGQAQNGTVLKGRVRFRLGKPDRGIGSARVAPALPVPPDG